eukprot:scaffold8835_cov70-Cyclotella_meneghiniana.AAC.5
MLRPRWGLYPVAWCSVKKNSLHFPLPDEWALHPYDKFPTFLTSRHKHHSNFTINIISTTYREGQADN